MFDVQLHLEGRRGSGQVWVAGQKLQVAGFSTCSLQPATCNQKIIHVRISPRHPRTFTHPACYSRRAMAMSDIELRILGSLLEKERTTPEAYPLTTNSLVLACNQKTNRDPVTSFDEGEVKTTLQNLRDKGLVVTTRADNERVYKHRHKLQQVFELNAKGFAVLAVLMLRGKQTPGELRGRTERYVSFSDVAEVETTLQRLAEHQPPLVKNYGRSPGQSQDRWGSTLGGDEERQRPRARVAKETMSELEQLRAEVDELRGKLERVYDHLGISEDSNG